MLATVVVALLAHASVFGQAISPRPGKAAAADTALARRGAGSPLSDRVLTDVARLRQLSVLRTVPSGLKSRDDIRAIVLRDMAETTTPARMHTTSLMLRFLGLVGPDFELEREATALLTEQIAGFYDPKSRYFYLADWIPLDEQRTIMAHELTHALTDQHFDLRRFEDWPEGDSDAELAARALVEGDATALMIVYSLDQRGAPNDLSQIPVSLTDMLRAGIADVDTEHPAYARAPEVLRQNLQFPYVYGAGFVQALLKAGSWRKVGDAYSALPQSTEQIMHPERYLAGDRPSPVALPDVSPQLGEGWRLADTDVNGEFGYFLVLKQELGDQQAATAAAGWGGDRFGFYVDGSGGNVALVQSTTWDSTGDAREFFSAYAKRIERRYDLPPSSGYEGPALEWTTPAGTARIVRAGHRVVIVEGYRGKLAQAVTDRLLPN